MLFDLFVTIMFLPLLCPILIIIKFLNLTKENNVILFGLDNVSTKTDNRGMKYKEAGYSVTYFSFESTIGTLENLEGGHLRKVNSFTVIAIFQLFIFYVKYRPKYLEIYFTKNYLIMYFVSFISVTLKIVNIVILRGSETMVLWKRKPLHRFLFIRTLKIVDWIYYRELWMENDLKNIDGINQKIIFDSNKVRVFKNEDSTQRVIDTVFLNSFKKWRNVDVLIDALSIVVSNLPDSRHLIIGAKNQDEFKIYQNLIMRYDISRNVQVKMWTDDSRSIFERTKLFLLPADIVFLNFSLLEAMERECVPIVWDVKDAEKVVNHGVNGVISNKSKEDLAQNIITLLGDDDTRVKLGKNARSTIIKNFNDSDRLNPILQEIRLRYS